MNFNTSSAVFYAVITSAFVGLSYSITSLRTELKSDISALRTDLKSDIAELRADNRATRESVDRLILPLSVPAKP